MTITRDQTAKMADAMRERYGDQVMVDFCMRYGNPSTKSKVREMVKAGCTRILFFPLYPQYAGATSATANDQFFRALMDEPWQPIARVLSLISTSRSISRHSRNPSRMPMRRQATARISWWCHITGCPSAI